MPAKAVLFDLDDTLVLTYAADKAAKKAVMELLRTHRPTLKQGNIVDHFWTNFITQPWDPTHQMDVTEWRAQLWNRALQEQGLDDIVLARDLQSCFDSTRMASFKWAPGVERIIKGLHDQGIKTGIITNGHPKVQRAKLESAEAYKLFDTIIVGGEETHEKPHESIFIKACSCVGCKPEESIMVGDNLKTDIQIGCICDADQAHMTSTQYLSQAFKSKMHLEWINSSNPSIFSGFFLNPRFQYEEGFVYNDTIRSGVTKVIERLAPDVTFAIEATREGAKNSNFLASIWVNIHGLEEIPDGVAKPDYTIKSMEELPQVLSWSNICLEF